MRDRVSGVIGMQMGAMDTKGKGGGEEGRFDIEGLVGVFWKWREKSV